MTKPATVPAVQRELNRLGVPLEFVRGEGYHYFIFDDRGPNYETESVMVAYTSHQSVERWVADAQGALETIRARIAGRN